MFKVDKNLSGIGDVTEKLHFVGFLNY